MCYSSQIAAAYQQYLKLTGATIDLDQFKEVYGFRHADASIRISPVVDRWFNEPKNADERAIKELIDRHRAGPRPAGPPHGGRHAPPPRAAPAPTLGNVGTRRVAPPPPRSPPAQCSIDAPRIVRG